MSAAEFQAQLQTHLKTVHTDCYEHPDCETCTELRKFFAAADRIKNGAQERAALFVVKYRPLLDDPERERPSADEWRELGPDVAAIKYGLDHELHPTPETADADREILDAIRALFKFRVSTPPPVAPAAPAPAATAPPSEPAPPDLLMCAACGFERPREDFTTVLMLLPDPTRRGYIDQFVKDRPHPRYPAEKQTRPWKRVKPVKPGWFSKNKNPSPTVDPMQRCDACFGERACVRCGRHFDHRFQSDDPAYVQRMTTATTPATPEHERCLLCRSSEYHRPITADEINLVWSLGRPPAETKPGDTPNLTLGTTPSGQAVTINDTDRTRHIYLIGGTGSGKSVTLTNLAIQDIGSGEGFTIIDPHGDLAQGVLAHVPPDHLDRVTYFDPMHDDAPPFNLLAADFDPSKLTADLVATFKMFFGESWGPQMEALLANALNTLLMDRVHEPHCFADLRRLLIDDDYRSALAKRCTDDIQRSFWDHEYKSMTKDAARPILTRLSTLLMAGSPLRRVLTTTANALDVRRIMDRRGILLVNLSKGALGDGPSRLLGGLFVTAITQAALARQSIPERDRTPHTLYCDEFQNFADLPSTESILSEARKYQLRLVLAHQTMAQVDARLMQNILGNVRTLVGFNVSPHDASVLARRMGRTRHLYPDTGEFYDLAVERQRVAERFVKRIHMHIDRELLPDQAPDLPLLHPEHKQPLAYGRKGFPATASPDAALAWLRSVADVDPASYDPGRSTEFNWKTATWPTPQDFQNLSTCHAFVMRNVASSTTALFVPFPPRAPHPDNLDRWHARRAAEIAATTSPRPGHGEERPHQKPQVARSATGAGVTPRENPPKSPKAPGDDFDEFLT